MTEVLGKPRVRTTAKALLFNSYGEALVLRTRGSDLFNLPGGGIKKGEAPYKAVVREIGEEVPGFEVHVSPHPVSELIQPPSTGKVAIHHLFVGEVDEPPQFFPYLSGQIPDENRYYAFVRPEMVKRRPNELHGLRRERLK